ncbi:hypothetical protein BIW11_08765 [Tropilaelaps mercedesae]|uniref:Uncharacterized protein n=1 Tax=Tropilaelaps mercedesae TaxID=418985 RepID=A0A1V9XN62_9ACAR|nr:hypothetical protein BIW11_08765 [Tropilaelaps mercedesae]
MVRIATVAVRRSLEVARDVRERGTDNSPAFEANRSTTRVICGPLRYRVTSRLPQPPVFQSRTTGRRQSGAEVPSCRIRLVSPGGARPIASKPANGLLSPVCDAPENSGTASPIVKPASPAERSGHWRKKNIIIEKKLRKKNQEDDVRRVRPAGTFIAFMLLFHSTATAAYDPFDYREEYNLANVVTVSAPRVISATDQANGNKNRKHDNHGSKDADPEQGMSPVAVRMEVGFGPVLRRY